MEEYGLLDVIRDIFIFVVVIASIIYNIVYIFS